MFPTIPPIMKYVSKLNWNTKKKTQTSGDSNPPDELLRFSMINDESVSLSVSTDDDEPTKLLKCNKFNNISINNLLETSDRN